MNCLKLSSPNFGMDALRALMSERYLVVEAPWCDGLALPYEGWASFFSSGRKAAFMHAPDKLPGYFPLCSETAVGAEASDPKEFFHYYENQVCPKELHVETQKLFRHLLTLGHFVLQEISPHLQNPSNSNETESLHQLVSDSSSVVLRVANYPASVATSKGNTQLAAEHKDIDLLTILPPATGPGLEVNNGQQWVPILPEFGKLTILAGELLEYVTNGVVPASLHRVHTLDSVHDRLSFNLFINPPPNVELAKGVTAGMLLKQRLQEIYGGNCA